MKTNEALKLAQEQNLDLVEVAAKAKPPVVRILDFKKHQFERKQQKKTSKKRTVNQETKQLRFGPNIGPHDLQTRINRAREFFNEGNKVKFSIFFRGREGSHPQIGYDKLSEVTKALSDVAEVGKKPKRKGRFIHMILRPKA